MDPFTQRMLERARARQEKIDQKLASSGQTPKRKPLTENIPKITSTTIKSPVKPVKETVLSPKRVSDISKQSQIKSPSRRSIKNVEVSSPKRNDIVVTKTVNSPRSSSRSNSDVSVEINIKHHDDIKIEVQVEEHDLYDGEKPSSVTVTEITDKVLKALPMSSYDGDRTEKPHIRQNVKSRLDRLGVLYSDKQDLSSPIQKTESDFNAATPPSVYDTPRPQNKKKFGRLAALADEINNWEDDYGHHGVPDPSKKPMKATEIVDKEASTLDVSIHSLEDVNKVLQSAKKEKPVNSSTYTKQSDHQLDRKIVAQLEGEGYRRVTADQSRLVYDFTTPEKTDRVRQVPSSASTTPSVKSAPMATAVATPPKVAKKPSLKKYKAPTPPVNEDASDNSDKNKENATESDIVEPKKDVGSPVVKRLAHLNGNVERNSVLSKAAMFEAASPKSKEKDPAEMSLRERKALFEKNKGSAIVPKAPFGQAPSAKALLGDKVETPKRPISKSSSSESSRTASKESIADNQPISGIKGKLVALFSKEQTISESSINNKVKQERDKEMAMLQSRFNYKPNSKPDTISDDDGDDPSEVAPLMGGSTLSLTQINRKPEIIANIPKIHSQRSINDKEDVVAAQPNKRRSSQDTPVVSTIQDDIKRVRVNDELEGPKQPQRLYPHLSDLDTDGSQNEFSDCGGSSETKLNKSDEWADTSFGREVMSVVKRNNASYQKAVASDYETSNSDMNSELDEMLDEALNDDESCGGPTPPKVQKNVNTLSSKSFTYEQGSPAKKQFKSPIKIQPPTPRNDKGSELVHSVSFYRRMQTASSQPSTPMRIVRNGSPERETSPDSKANVLTVKEKIKELQAEVVKQQTVISQASQALNLCAATIEFSGSQEQAEGERLLLLATHRRQACLHEMQRLQVEGAGPSATKGYAKLKIKGITAPLRRDYMRQLNADGAVGHHAVCLLKCRDRVLASSMQLTTPTNNTIHFPDEIRMEGLASDFKVTVEIYLLQASKEVLPHEVKYHIFSKKSSSKLLTPKSKVSELKAPRIQSPAGPMAVRSPQFQLHGYCIFALQQANRNTFTLNKVPMGSPVEGSIRISIEASLSISAPPPFSAFLTAFDDVSGLGAWHRRWFVLQPPRLTYWKYPDDVHKKMPIGDIDLTTVISTQVIKAPRDLCARPNTLLLECSIPQGLIIPDNDSLVYFRNSDGVLVRRHLLAADTVKERDEWIDSLNKALEYVRCTCTSDD